MQLWRRKQPGHVPVAVAALLLHWQVTLSQKCPGIHILTDYMDLLLGSTQQLFSLCSLLVLHITLQSKEDV